MSVLSVFSCALFPLQQRHKSACTDTHFSLFNVPPEILYDFDRQHIDLYWVFFCCATQKLNYLQPSVPLQQGLEE